MNEPPDPSPAAPGPAWWQAALTRLVLTVFGLLVTLYYVSLFLAIRSLADTDGPSARPTIIDPLWLMVLTPMLVVVLRPVKWQYLGTFHGDSDAAAKAQVVWDMVAGILLAFTVPSLNLRAIAIVAPLAAAFVGLGFANQRRREQLERHSAAHPDTRSRQGAAGGRRGWIWIPCGALAVMGLALVLPIGPSPLVERVDAAHVPFALPAGATDVSYSHCRHGTWIALEFTTDEQRFRDWITSARFAPDVDVGKNVAVGEIEEPFWICRYLRGVHRKPDKDAGDDDGRHAIVREGLKYAWKAEDHGVRAAFDRRTSRAYCYVHSF